MDEQNTGVYLTERLRTSDPEYFDHELARGKRVAGRLGFLAGGVVALVLTGLSIFSLFAFAPGYAEALFIGLQ